MESQTFRQCHTCYQQIDARARRCPFCHQWQTRWAALAFHPATAVVPFALCFVFIAFMQRSLFARGVSFDAFRDQVQVTASHVTFGKTDCGATLAVLGTLKNTSDVAWKDLHWELRFFDREGKLIDTAQSNAYEFVLAARAEAPFKVSVKREFPAEQYASHALRLIAARDAKTLF
jgi:hypothetical protein